MQDVWIWSYGKVMIHEAAGTWKTLGKWFMEWQTGYHLLLVRGCCGRFLYNPGPPCSTCLPCCLPSLLSLVDFQFMGNAFYIRLIMVFFIISLMTILLFSPAKPFFDLLHHLFYMSRALSFLLNFASGALLMNRSLFQRFRIAQAISCLFRSSSCISWL